MNTSEEMRAVAGSLGHQRPRSYEGVAPNDATHDDTRPSGIKEPSPQERLRGDPDFPCHDGRCIAPSSDVPTEAGTSTLQRIIRIVDLVEQRVFGAAVALDIIRAILDQGPADGEVPALRPIAPKRTGAALWVAIPRLNASTIDDFTLDGLYSLLRLLGGVPAGEPPTRPTEGHPAATATAAGGRG
ncbi:hypothetical protein [Embleya sp. NPDC059237]|uniref:hypothetical protein n=1 Tax=Embleya sp. NPDC059237 TaxID=3346784 RepID=UPI00367685AD